MKFYFFLPGIAWFIISAVLLAIPGNNLPTTGLNQIPYFDKMVHLGMFFLLIFFFCVPFRFSSLSLSRGANLFAIISTLGFAFGIAMEFVQKFLVANRSFDEVDIVCDGIGCLAGALVSWKIFKKDRPR